MAPSTTIRETESAPLKLATEQLSELQNTSRILHLLHHRNYNQHRRQHWYPSFSTFRSHLNHLIHDITVAQNPKSLPSTLLPSRRREIGKICEQKVAKRLELWRTVIVRKWFGSFSQLVGDNQFAVLGLVLLGCLGRVCEVTGITEQMVEEGEDVGVELRGFIEGQEVEKALGGSEGDIGVPIPRDGDSDLGEAVMREGEVVLVKDEGEVSTMLEEGSIPIIHTKAKPKKRKLQDSSEDGKPQKATRKTKKMAKKKDAIDDLFSGLF